jgi:hypothetical protein
VWFLFVQSVESHFLPSVFLGCLTAVCMPANVCLQPLHLAGDCRVLLWLPTQTSHLATCSTHDCACSRILHSCVLLQWAVVPPTGASCPTVRAGARLCRTALLPPLHRVSCCSWTSLFFVSRVHVCICVTVCQPSELVSTCLLARNPCPLPTPQPVSVLLWESAGHQTELPCLCVCVAYAGCLCVVSCV